MGTTTILIQALFTLVVALALIGWFTRPATDPVTVMSFAASHELELTHRNLPMVTYYVRLAIILRAIGGVSGLILGSLFDDATGLDTSAGAGFWIWILMGWLLGAGWAEWRLTRPTSLAFAASLTPRRVEDYLSRGLWMAPVAVAVLCAALAVARIALPEPVPEPVDEVAAPVAAYVVGAIGAAVIALVVRLAIRTVVARRQPTAPADIVAADDAIRATAVHNLAGGGTAAILLIASQMSFILLQRYEDLGGLAVAVGLALALAAFAAWRWYAFRGWRVRREQTRATAAAP
jgi:hypothetical protein